MKKKYEEISFEDELNPALEQLCDRLGYHRMFEIFKQVGDGSFNAIIKNYE